MQTIRLTTGAELPSVGLGLWKIAPEAAVDLVYQAVQRGYRHLDSACDYGNEPAVGAGIQQVLQQRLCRREELWVTSKLWNTDHAPEHVRLALENPSFLDNAGLSVEAGTRCLTGSLRPPLANFFRVPTSS